MVAPLAAGCGYYRPAGQTAKPFVATGVTVSGWTLDNRDQWVPVQNVQLDPAKTWLQSQCSCPVSWQLVPLI